MNNILELENLYIGYGESIIVKDFNLNIKKGENIGIVGESGSGKSTLAKAITYFSKIHKGKIIFKGQDITYLKKSKIKDIRKDIQMIIQDSKTSFNPKMTVYEYIEEPLKNFTKLDKNQRYNRITGLIDQVGLELEHLERYPWELSGGQRQRVAITRALAIEAKLLICDEITSALDVSVQKQIIDLLLDIQKDNDINYIFISHDIALMLNTCDRLVIMNQGELVEEIDCHNIGIIKNSYTKKLMDSTFTI